MTGGGPGIKMPECGESMIGARRLGDKLGQLREIDQPVGIPRGPVVVGAVDDTDT
jgi:hypothetical protein